MRTRKFTLLAVMAPVAALLVTLPAQTASAASQTYTNACRNSAVGTNWDQINVTNNMTSPTGPVPAGSSVTLSGISTTMSIPGAIFVAGYNLGLLTPGLNNIPGDIKQVIDATNATPASQTTNTVSTTLSTTITDPDGTPGSGDETATDASATVNFADLTWTAGASGTMNFAEHNDPAVTGVAGGGLIAIANLAGGAIKVQFHCTSGTVAGSNPGVPTFSNAPTVTSTPIAGVLAANAGTDQSTTPGAAVTLNGSASGGTSPYSFAWTQTSGTTVTLSGANTASPTFTAPSPLTTESLGFQLQVTDSTSPTPQIATDSVNVTVNVTPPPPPVCSQPGSSCTDAQNFRVTVGAGTLVISTPYTAENPFDLGTMTVDPTGTFMHAQADFGNTANLANGVTVTDTRTGSNTWTAQVSAGDFASGANTINSCNLGFTGVTPQYISGNALQSGVVTTDVPNGGSAAIAAAGDTACTTGLRGPAAHTFATATPGLGSVYITGVMDLYAPTSAPAGIYDAIVTFTIS